MGCSMMLIRREQVLSTRAFANEKVSEGKKPRRFDDEASEKTDVDI